MLNKLKKAFKIKNKEIEVGESKFIIINETEFKEVRGDEYYVIGYQMPCGNPIVAKTNDDKFPVFLLPNNDVNLKTRIAGSIKDFIKILNMLTNTNFKNEESISKFLKDLNFIDAADYEFWFNLIKNI